MTESHALCPSSVAASVPVLLKGEEVFCCPWSPFQTSGLHFDSCSPLSFPDFPDFFFFFLVDYPCMNVSRFSLGHLHFSAKLYFHSCRLLRELACGVSVLEYVWCVLGLGVMVTVVSLSKAEHLFIFFCAIFTLVVSLTACLTVSPSFSLHSFLLYLYLD